MPPRYRPFPPASEIAIYSSRLLPSRPRTPAASRESLNEVNVPSASLFKASEFNHLLSYSPSQYSFSSGNTPSSPELSRAESSDTISNLFSALPTPDNSRYQDFILRPPPDHPHRRDDSVETRLSSASTTVATPPSSSKNRSVTPTLLLSLSSDLSEKLALHEEDYSPSTKPTTMDTSALSSRSARKVKPTHITFNAGCRNISPPMPSPVFNNNIFGPALTSLDQTDNSYQQYRPPPLTPNETHEVSCMDWDDDDDDDDDNAKTRFARTLKKSMTDLRTVGRNKTSPKTSPPMAPVPLPQPPQMRQLSRPTSHAVNVNLNTISTLSSTTPVQTSRLIKKPSLKTPRKRGWSHTSFTSSSERTTSGVSQRNSPSSITTALPRAESRHLTTTTKRKRFSSVAGVTSGRQSKRRRVSLGRLGSWMGWMFGC